MTTTGEFLGDPNEGRPRHLVRRAVATTWRQILRDRVLGLAAEAGFWALLSLPSMLLAIFGLLGYFRGILGAGNVLKIHDDIIRAARDVLTPNAVNSDVVPIVNQILSKGHLEVVSISFVISLWSGSTAMSDYVNVITVAYDMRGLRSAVRSRIIALGLYLGFVLAGLLLLPALALGPDVIVSLFPGSLRGEVSLAIHSLYWPVVGLGSIAVLTTLYMLCLPVRVRWRRGVPGALVAVTVWLAGSFLVRAYLTSSFRTKSAYGSLSAPIAALLFFYVTALAVLIGAELNSAIDSVAPVQSTASGRARSRRRAAGEVTGQTQATGWDPTPGQEGTWAG